MSLVSVFWFPHATGLDLHLLPGLTSPRLDHLLAIADTRGNGRADSPHAGVSVSFEAQFDGAPANHGVTLDPGTGQIMIADPLPAGPRLRHFLVTARAREGARDERTSIRVFVHEQITRLWLTPDPLTVRQGARDVRLTLMARFDDGVIGDITNWSPIGPPAAADRTFVRASGTPTTPRLAWSTSDAATVGVHATTGVLAASAAVGGATITVEHPPLPAPPTARATATVNCAPGWATPVRLTHVAGPGFAAMGTVHNILFLPDGFQNTGADRAGFERLVRGVVSRLSVRQRTRPFDLLRGRLNYFMGWVPSPQGGVSVLNELDRVNKAGTRADGRPMEMPSRDGGPPTPWTLEDLLNEVGPPTPVNDPDGSPLGTAAAGRLRDWQTLYGLHITPGRMGHVYAAWRDRNDRVLLSERDTAFHLGVGTRPRVDGHASERSLTFNPRRVHEDDFDLFLNALQDAGGAAVPDVWERGAKDDDLVVFLCRTTRNAGSNAFRGDGRYLAMSLADDHVHRIEADPGGDGFRVRPDAIPAQVHPDTWTTAAHELAHSWTLGDEYGGNRVLTPSLVADLAQKSNLQPRSALLDGAGDLVTATLKWRWPRLAKAAVLAGVPVASGANFRLPLVPGQGTPFAVGDIVRLRTRPLLAAASPSGRLRVTARAADQLEVEPLPGTVLAPAGFPAGSIVAVPVRAADPAPGVLGDDLELAAQSVRDRIDATHNPLNAADGAPANRPCPDVTLAMPTPATNFPAGTAPRPPRFSSWIVGLYENGAVVNCDVYRPTGICLMGVLLYVDPAAGRERSYQFCTVCRYAMVDHIDPTQHGAIDADYAPRYPA